MVFAAIPFLFAVACVLVIVERARGKSPVPTPRVPGRIPLEETPLPLVVVFMLVLGSIGVAIGCFAYQGILQRQHCKEWARTGQYEVAEGTIADYQLRKGSSSFRIAGQAFDLLNVYAGFTGRFNVAGAESKSLRNELPVRLAHRDGFILRIEIAR
jgi:hypothetical protein